MGRVEPPDHEIKKEDAVADSNRASLEANACDKGKAEKRMGKKEQNQLEEGMPSCPEDNLFLSFAPWLFEYCEAYVKKHPELAQGNSTRIKIPLVHEKDRKGFCTEPKIAVNDGKSMLRKVRLGHSNLLEVDYQFSGPQQVIGLVSPCSLEIKSLIKSFMPPSTAPILRFDKKQGEPDIYMTFKNPSPAALRGFMEAPPEDILRRKLEKPKPNKSFESSGAHKAAWLPEVDLDEKQV